jgi:hypothetical protein
MKSKELNPRKSAENQGVPIDPILLAATVPSRKPTKKDIADTVERADDAIEPKEG